MNELPDSMKLSTSWDRKGSGLDTISAFKEVGGASLFVSRRTLGSRGILLSGVFTIDLCPPVLPRGVHQARHRVQSHCHPQRSCNQVVRVEAKSTSSKFPI